MATQEQLTTPSLSGLACLQTKYEYERNTKSFEVLLINQKLAQVRYEVMSRNLHPDDNYPKERIPFYG